MNLSALGASVPVRLGAWGPAVLALVISGGGGLLLRGRPGWVIPVAAAAAAAGWAALMPVTWQAVIWPRVQAEWLVMPALAIAGAGIAGVRWQSRWWTVAAVCFAGWWLASSPGGRMEFWRVEFGSVAAAWALTRAGAGVPVRGLAAALTLLGGVWVGAGATVWVSALAVLGAAVLGTVSLGLLTAGRAGAVSPGLLMLGLVGAELGAGRAVRGGGLGTVDLACLGAMLAPLGVPVMERRLRRL